MQHNVSHYELVADKERHSKSVELLYRLTEFVGHLEEPKLQVESQSCVLEVIRPIFEGRLMASVTVLHN